MVEHLFDIEHGLAYPFVTLEQALSFDYEEEGHLKVVPLAYP